MKHRIALSQPEPVHLPERMVATLEAAVSRAMIPAELLAAILAGSGYGPDQAMTGLLPLAARHTYNPISHYAVGAVAMGRSRTGALGNLYLGANFEFARLVPGFTVHAEQSAVNNAWLCGEPGIECLAVDSTPCGMCRQFLNELPNSSTLRVLTSAPGATPASQHSQRSQPLGQLLPNAFGPGDLGVEGRFMQDGVRQLTLPAADPTAQAALTACNASYAPYTQAHAGLALRSIDGTLYKGRYAENAAYNPSLLAIQSALAHRQIQAATAAMPAIVDAVLVERAHPVISQHGVTRLILDAACPGLPLRYISV